MFDPIFIKKIKYFALFIVVYTIAFFLFFSTLSYTLPFVIAILIALFTKPLTRFLRRKLKFSRGISSLASTLIVFTLLFVVLSIIVLKITSEARQLINASPDFETYKKFIETSLERLKAYSDQVDAQILERLKDQLTSLIYKTYDIIIAIIGKLFTLAIGLPVVVMIIFITLIATFFFTRDIVDMENNVLSIFSNTGRQKVISIWQEGVSMLVGYAKSYSLIIFIGFLETLIGFSIIGVKYSLMLSMLSAFADVLPVLGVSAVYLPLAIFHFITGRTATGIFIIVWLAVVTVVRQILEPKLVSSSLGLHPLAVLAAIYIGIKAYGFIGMIYLIFLMVFYRILKKVKIL